MTYNKQKEMEFLAAQLKRKQHQIMDNQLTLPVIPQKGNPLPPLTSARRRKQKKTQQYASETTLSPEEEHLQDQIRLLFHPKQKRPPRASLKSIPIDVTPSKPNKDASLPRITRSHEKIIKKVSTEHILSPQKRGLDFILQNKNEFIQNYFVQLKYKHKK